MSKGIIEPIEDVRDRIVSHLRKDDRSLLWMTEKIKEKFGDDNKIPYTTLYSCLHQKLFKMSDKNLIKINSVLGTNFSNE